ncbi:uncharacterized protein Tco025E_00923 [Trypanosoma conorhini]|uniref:C2H2-type domain-containing protein n=1 Tax=Trypanosoma conorhini TaxID=83891 RepID=A0A422QA59_9TRYP|nr:uncharacterized protein Tco025E_00923 [Trypanosoma conorhini]RNF26841.1 hypothetical protein Tco025E_00923 [Trypanosoma conorhini]
MPLEVELPFFFFFCLPPDSVSRGLTGGVLSPATDAAPHFCRFTAQRNKVSTQASIRIYSQHRNSPLMARPATRVSGEVGQQNQEGRRCGNGGGENETNSSECPILRCPECLNGFSTWSRLTAHLNASAHFSARCVTCGEQLRCYGPTHPYRHEAATGHVGFFGTFYTRSDYRLDHPPVFTHPQYRCVCRVTFLCPLQLALHLRMEHAVTAIPDVAVCRTCNMHGSLAELAAHRLKRLLLKEDDVIEVPGFSPAPYLVRWPKIPPWTVQKKPYAVLYQCPICVSVFTSWAAMENHIEKNCVCQCMLDPIGARSGNTSHAAGAHRFSPEEFEVLLDTSEPEMLSLLQGASQRQVGDSAQEEDLVLVFQCPVETCSRLFLTHGELQEHMEEQAHFPSAPGAEAEGATQDGLSWKCNLSDYEVMCSARRLVEEFGLSRCPHCCRVLSHGMETHHQLFHPEA